MLVEIVIKEKQKAVGLQPMLYVCFPVTKLKGEKRELIGRCAEQNEKAVLLLDKTHKDFILGTFKIFALLSKAHKSDVISINNKFSIKIIDCYFSIITIVTAPNTNVLKCIFLKPAFSIICLYSFLFGKWYTESGKYL